MPSQYEALKFSEQKRARSGVYYICETCKKQFYATMSRVRQVQKKGFHIRFCSKGCYVKNGPANPFFGKKHSADSVLKMEQHPNRQRFKPGKDNPNFVRYGADYEPIISSNWRPILLHDAATCGRCGWGKFPGVLQLHHKDRNRKNNTRDNLEVLCPNCHTSEHYIAGDGHFHQGRLKLRKLPDF